MKRKSYTYQTLKIYLSASKKTGADFWLAVTLWPLGISLQSIILPLIISGVINKLTKTSSLEPNYLQQFLPYIVLFLVILTLGQFLIISSLRKLAKFESLGTAILTQKAFNKLLELSMGFYNNNFGGALVSKVTRFISSYTTVMDILIIRIVDSFIKIILALIVLSIFAPKIALFIFIWSVIIFYYNYISTKKRMKYSWDRAASETKVTAHFSDVITNMATVKSSAMENSESKTNNKLAEDRRLKTIKTWNAAIKATGVTHVMAYLMSIIVLIFSIIAMQNNDITIGTVVLAQFYCTMIAMVLVSSTDIIKNLERAFADAEEMTEILNLKPMVEDAPHAIIANIKDGQIVFEGVGFTHDNNMRLFSDLNLKINKDEKIGLVGSSGGGKTTITKLILRFIDVDEGKILIDGINIKDMPQESLRKSIAYVPQEPLLFHRSIADNISYDSDNKDIESIINVAKMAHAHEFIKDLPDGYDTLVGERGVKLSGGQRQRVAIARAMLKNAPILILDEATSALDSESEVLIQDALWKLMDGKTAIVIAHRLSTIQKMDAIVVLDKGQIVEQGTHKELIRQNGVYASLWSHQSGGFIEE